MGFPDYLTCSNSVSGKRSQGVDTTRFAHGIIVRAYITEVYGWDDASQACSPAATGLSGEFVGVLCDVMVIETGVSGSLYKVPVMSGSAGFDDVSFWRPRKATKTASGDPFTLAATTVSTPLSATDGDLVVIGFLGNDLAQPVILGKLPNHNTTYPVTTANLDNYAWINRAKHALLGVEETGRVVIDTNTQFDTDNTLDDEIVLRTSGATITASGSGIAVEGNNQGTSATTQTGLTISVGAGQTVSISGNGTNIGGAEAVVLETTLTDLATVLTEWYPVIQAAAGFFGVTLVHSAALIPALTAGVSLSGSSYTSTSTETD